MTRNHLIFTHGAVFSVGIAAALIANGFRQESAGPAGAADSPAQRRAAAASGLGGSDETAGPRGSRAGSAEGRTSEQRNSKPATEQIAAIVRITDAFERQRALMDLVDGLGPEQFAAVMDQFRDADHLGDARGEYELLLRGWAKVDPLGALDYAAEHGNRRYTSATILQTWAGTDAAAAERWALANHDGDGPNPYMAAVIRGVAANDLATATRLATEMPLSRERGEAVDAITRALFMQSPEAAMAYPASITDDALRGGFVSAIADRLVRKDAAAAADWIAGMNDGAIQNRAARRVSDALAREDVDKAAAWVKTLQPEAQVEAARGVIPRMSADDIAGTAKWVSTLAGTPGYDNAVEEFVWSCNSRAPEQSAAWIAGVSNPDQQRRLYHRMLGEWAQRDAAAVKQWVTANNVPPDVQRRFMR